MLYANTPYPLSLDADWIYIYIYISLTMALFSRWGLELYIYLMVVQKVLSFTQKKRAIVEDFCSGNTLPLLIKLEKQIQVFVQVRRIQKRKVW